MATMKISIILALTVSVWTLSANATTLLRDAPAATQVQDGMQLAYPCPVCGYRMVYKRYRWWGQWVRVWWCPDDC